jgi:hypothetical protein
VIADRDICATRSQPMQNVTVPIFNRNKARSSTDTVAVIDICARIQQQVNNVIFARLRSEHKRWHDIAIDLKWSIDIN